GLAQPSGQRSEGVGGRRGRGATACTGELPEIHQPDGTGSFSCEAVPHPHATRADQLRGLSSMSTERMDRTTKSTGNTLDNEMHKGAQAETGTPMTLARVREELKGTKGKKYWRSIDELANTEDFQAAVEREFPSAAQEWVDPVSRR